MPNISSIEKSELKALLKRIIDDDSSLKIDQIDEKLKIAIVLGSFLHRRQIRTRIFNEILRSIAEKIKLFDTVYSYSEDEKREIKQLSFVIDQLLEDFDFNFKESNIELEFSDSLIEKILKETRSARLNHPKVRSRVSSFARRVIKDLTSQLGFSPLSVEDVESQLYECLISYGEKKFDPRKSSYVTFATMLVHFRATKIFKDMMNHYSTNQLTDFQYRRTERETESNVDEILKIDQNHYQDDDTNEFELLFEQETELIDSIVQKEITSRLFTNLTPFERAIIFYEEFLSLSAENFIFLSKNSQKLTRKKLKEISKDFSDENDNNSSNCLKKSSAKSDKKKNAKNQTLKEAQNNLKVFDSKASDLQLSYFEKALLWLEVFSSNGKSLKESIHESNIENLLKLSLKKRKKNFRKRLNSIQFELDHEKKLRQIDSLRLRKI